MKWCIALVFLACAPKVNEPPTPEVEDGGEIIDAGFESDAGEGIDAGEEDAGVNEEDSGVPEDAGAPEFDAGVRIIVSFEPGEESPAGTATTPTRTLAALKQSVFTTSTAWRSRFTLGRALFEVPWEPAPGNRPERDGLGPLFHGDSCLACHNAYGRGTVEAGVNAAVPVLLRVSVDGGAAPGYGIQLQPRAIPGVASEGTVQLISQIVEIDGAELTRTVVSVTPALPVEVQTSLRISPALAGLGLLEAVPDEELAMWADEHDENGDGISGRLAMLPNGEVGRFGWKALNHAIADQTAGALLEDMGLTSPLHPVGPCVDGQTACLAAMNGGEPEVPQTVFDDLVFFTHLLGVPTRVDAGTPDILEGKQAFYDVGCQRCHRPSMQTNASAQPIELADQTLWPYSDLLLHDLGDALADGRPEGAANGNEWRTAPLWALSLSVQTVTGRVGYLHDGRARTLDEAIRWHGGEAASSTRKYLALTPAEREALIRFVESL
jgi:CxxC motif-containing protein (DUF1111 family)